MDATIILNKDALNALFPPDSEVRLKLTENILRSVLQEKAGSAALSSAALKLIDSKVNEARLEVLREVGILNRLRAFQELSGEFKLQIRQQAVAAVNECAYASVNAAVADLGAVDAAVNAALKRLIDKRASVELSAMVEESVKAQIQAKFARLAGEAS